MNAMTKKQKNMLIRILAAAVMMAALTVLQLKNGSMQTLLPLKDIPVLRFVLYLVPYLTVGYDILRKAWKGIRNRQVFDENFLMAAATVGAMALGEYAEAVAVMLFYQIGELFQSYAVGKSRRNISALMDIRPDYANLLVEEDAEEGMTENDTNKNGKTEKIEKVDPDDVEAGSIILIQPGERVPIDGIVIEGTSALDTSALTGESMPRDVRKGQEILSGSINLSGVLRVRTTKEFEESTASRILELVENAGSRKARSEQFITKFARWYTPAVCCSALALAILGPLVSMLALHSPGGRALWGDWIYRALTFLVISCPCAIVVSIPLTFFGGIGGAGSKGILIKGSNFMETLANVRTAAFDKTGTLTKGNFAVTKICPVYADGQEDLLKFAALAEIYSNHPISKSLKDAYKKPLVSVRIGKSREISGKGVITVLDGRHVAVGNLQLMKDQGVNMKADGQYAAADAGLSTANDISLKVSPEKETGMAVRSGSPEKETGTIVHVAMEKDYLGYIVISDELKPSAEEAVRALKAAGVTRTVMLTGDAENIAARVAAQLGIDEYHAGLLPDEKVRLVESLLSQDSMNPASDNPNVAHSKAEKPKAEQINTANPATARQPSSLRDQKNGNQRKSGTLAFVGDGINDAPVLSRADIGIAMGALGSDAAIEAADVVLMDDDPRKIAQAIRIARKCIRIVNENIWFAIGVKLLCLILGTLGIANMWLAIFADVGVMVLCVLNAVRALA